MFHIVVSTKGGVGKSTLAKEVVATNLFATGGKKVRLLEIDDCNMSSRITSSVLSVESFSVSSGIKEAQKALFEVFNKEDVVLDVGGGNDTNILLNSIRGLGIANQCVFYIPLLKNKSGIKNLVDVYTLIREIGNSKIYFIQNQCKSYKKSEVELEFAYLHGNKDLNIKSAFPSDVDVFNMHTCTIHDTNVFDLSESYGLTVYEIANEDISEDFLITEAQKGRDAYDKAFAYLNIYNLCKEYKEKTLDKFYEDCKL